MCVGGLPKDNIGTPADVINAALEIQELIQAEKVKAEMIIIGSHEHGKFYHLIFGSTHNLLIKKSTIPVLTIPPHIKE